MGEYGLVVFAGLVAASLALWVGLGWVIAPRPTRAAREPFQWGERATVARMRSSGTGTLVAIAFTLVEVALIALFAWAAAFRDLGGFGLLAALPFFLVLSVAVAYAWLRGALDWE